MTRLLFILLIVVSSLPSLIHAREQTDDTDNYQNVISENVSIYNLPNRLQVNDGPDMPGFQPKNSGRTFQAVNYRCFYSDKYQAVCSDCYKPFSPMGRHVPYYLYHRNLRL